MRRIDCLRFGWISLALIAVTVLFAAVVIAGTRFPHPTHQEAGLECAACHADAATSQKGGDHLIPQAAVCLDCHAQEDLDGWGWSPPPPAKSGFPKFSHEAHIALVDGDCARCHGALIDANLTGTGKGEIGHAVCFECHNGREIDDSCEGCHDNIHTIRPLDHGPDFVHTHQFSARGSSGDCEECHRQSEQCSECHQGENVLFMSHDRNYLFTHAMDARKHENDCASCHEIATFCNDCHMREGIKPANHADNWTTGTQQHASEARRDISNCASCHTEDEPLCIRCHSDRNPGRGNDRSIHPSGFDNIDVKGEWHFDKTYYCFDCHARVGGVDRFCTYCHP